MACRFPPRYKRMRLVLPLEAGIGQTPQSFANAASDLIRSGLSPTRISISATVIVENNWRDNVEIIVDEGRRHIETKHHNVATIDAVGSGMVTLW